MFATMRALHARAGMRDVFEHGDYVPLRTTGSRRDCLFAFARREGDRVAITCVPRMVASLVPDAAGPPLGAAVWSDTRIELPTGREARGYRDVFSGSTIEPSEGTLAAAAVFERFPIALLI